MTLTEFFYMLPQIDRAYNKYATYSLAFNNPYRLCTGYEVFKYDKFDNYLKNWLVEQGKCIAMPSLLNGEVISIMFRSISSKQFRYYSEARYIPYGAGTNNKSYYKPWVIVESALDSDFLRNFYPFVIATNGTAVSANCMSFLNGTASTVYCGFDSDQAGEDSFNNLRRKYSGSSKQFHICRLEPPINFEGKHLKDFGEVLDCLHNRNMGDYSYYVMAVKESLSLLQII